MDGEDEKAVIQALFDLANMGQPTEEASEDADEHDHAAAYDARSGKSARGPSAAAATQRSVLQQGRGRGSARGKRGGAGGRGRYSDEEFVYGNIAEEEDEEEAGHAFDAERPSRTAGPGPSSRRLAAAAAGRLGGSRRASPPVSAGGQVAGRSKVQHEGGPQRGGMDRQVRALCA